LQTSDIKISVIIPAHNEEHFLPKGLEAIRAAEKNSPHPVEVVVVINRCSDRTEEIAKKAGAIVVKEDTPNLSMIRNAGLAAATGDILITVDADSCIHPMTFHDVVEKLDSGKFIGGGCYVLPERYSLGIICSMIMLTPRLMKHGVSFGCFWFTREVYEAVEGFDTSLLTVEDIDFAIRIKKHGKKLGKKFGCLYRSVLKTSCRKFDQYGEWYMVRDPSFVRKVFDGHDQETADRYWYKTGR